MRVNLNVYLPDDLGERAKDADLPLSRMLREAVITELNRRAIMSETLEEPQEQLVDIVSDGGVTYTGRFTGTLIAGGNDVDVYLTTDKRTLVYDRAAAQIRQVDDPEDLREWLDLDGYVIALEALGAKPVIDI
jgi:post-segregation antitoxin (ccd killing protein)